MRIRPFQPGDEVAQVEIYNRSASGLPGFRPAQVEDVLRRLDDPDADPGARLYAVDEGRVVGYGLFNPSGRISYPWCLSGCEHVREPLLTGVLDAMRAREFVAAWATYRADWSPLWAFFEAHGFARTHEMVNYLAPVESLPDEPVPPGSAIVPVGPESFPEILALGRGLFEHDDADRLTAYYRHNPYLGLPDLFALRDEQGGRLRGLGVAIIDDRYADPTQIDPSMPCFRLGTLGTESQRHKRINGLASLLFEDESDGRVLLSETHRRFAAAGLTHAAAQASSHCPALLTFYDRHFTRQASFPIHRRDLA